ncbi:hypothetical protein QYE76_006682 [Lolium multiflorum]|uniref:RRM domain-containing protein n=1 Tax=Lolium multiflorum TaxID=4521 RepID=A0AAD8RX40_LOLMU|nr:hypothetical protein QYE76_006682 [Lolium multiflorum]
MAGRRQRKKKKKRDTRAATMKKKIVKEESKPAPQGNERRWQKRTCSFCGVSRIHENDHFCPYNYINGAFSLSTCRARCQPGKHPLLLPSSSSSGSGSGSHHLLRRLVRVTNVPLSAIPGESDLCRLFGRFGPLVGSNLTSMSLHDPVGFGWVAFESREHAEEAIDKLNGHLVGDRKLRVDWVYPQT